MNKRTVENEIFTKNLSLCLCISNSPLKAAEHKIDNVAPSVCKSTLEWSEVKDRVFKAVITNKDAQSIWSNLMSLVRNAPPQFKLISWKQTTSHHYICTYADERKFFSLPLEFIDTEAEIKGEFLKTKLDLMSPTDLLKELDAYLSKTSNTNAKDTFNVISEYYDNRDEWIKGFIIKKMGNESKTYFTGTSFMVSVTEKSRYPNIPLIESHALDGIIEHAFNIVFNMLKRTKPLPACENVTSRLNLFLFKGGSASAIEHTSKSCIVELWENYSESIQKTAQLLLKERIEGLYVQFLNSFVYARDKGKLPELIKSASGTGCAELRLESITAWYISSQGTQAEYVFKISNSTTFSNLVNNAYLTVQEDYKNGQFKDPSFFSVEKEVIHRIQESVPMKAGGKRNLFSPDKSPEEQIKSKLLGNLVSAYLETDEEIKASQNVLR